MLEEIHNKWKEFWPHFAESVICFQPGLDSESFQPLQGYTLKFQKNYSHCLKIKIINTPHFQFIRQYGNQIFKKPAEIESQ